MNEGKEKDHENALVLYSVLTVDMHVRVTEVRKLTYLQTLKIPPKTSEIFRNNIRSPSLSPTVALHKREHCYTLAAPSTVVYQGGHFLAQLYSKYVPQNPGIPLANLRDSAKIFRL